MSVPQGTIDYRMVLRDLQARRKATSIERTRQLEELDATIAFISSNLLEPDPTPTPPLDNHTSSES